MRERERARSKLPKLRVDQWRDKRLTVLNVKKGKEGAKIEARL